MHGRGQSPVEVTELVRAEPLNLCQCHSGVSNEPCYIDVLTPGRKWLEVPGTAGQHVHGTVMIQPPQLVEGNANLEDALVQSANLTALSFPERLQRLVLLEVLTPVELCNPFKQEVRGPLLTPRDRRPAS